jgi:hypothetical protein
VVRGEPTSARSPRVDPQNADAGVDVTAAEFATLFRSVQSWGRWGAGDELGALNLICV